MKEATKNGNLFRTLNAEEIECRIAKVGRSSRGPYAQVVLYKDARCDMALLDETFGPFGWRVENIEIKGNLYCTVSVKSPEGEWIQKQDVGVESSFEPEKGEASDAFKRACTRWGAGRELYTGPKIFINLNDEEVYNNQGKLQTSVFLYVAEIGYNSRRQIDSLTIKDSEENVRFVYHEKIKTSSSKGEKKEEDAAVSTPADKTEAKPMNKETITPSHKGWKSFVTAVMSYSMTQTPTEIRKRIEEKYFISDNDFRKLFLEATGKEVA